MLAQSVSTPSLLVAWDSCTASKGPPHPETPSVTGLCPNCVANHEQPRRQVLLGVVLPAAKGAIGSTATKADSSMGSQPSMGSRPKGAAARFDGLWHELEKPPVIRGFLL
jgi:hypothetical protein